MLWVPETYTLFAPDRRRGPAAALRLLAGPSPRTRRGPAAQPGQGRHRRVTAGSSSRRRRVTTGSGSGTVVGVGLDAVDLDRFRALLARRPRLSGRLFTDGERAYAGQTADPVPRLATRFAAKEATMKALGVGLGAFAFADVEVVRERARAAPPRCCPARPRSSPGWPGSAAGTCRSPTPTWWPWPWWWPKGTGRVAPRDRTGKRPDRAAGPHRGRDAGRRRPGPGLHFTRCPGRAGRDGGGRGRLGPARRRLRAPDRGGRRARGTTAPTAGWRPRCSGSVAPGSP